MKRIFPDEWTAGVCRAHDAALRLNESLTGFFSNTTLIAMRIGEDMSETEFTCDEDIDSYDWAALQCLANEKLIVGVAVVTRLRNEGGVYRLNAVTGHKAYREAGRTWATARELSQILQVPIEHTVERVKNLPAQRDKLLAQIAAMEQGPSVAALLAGATELYGVKLILQEFPGISAKQMRATITRLCTENAKVCVMLVNQASNGTTIVAGLSDDLVDAGLSASIWVAKVAEVAGGSGGGANCIAQGGGPKTDVLHEVVERAHHCYISMMSELIGDEIC